MRCWWLLRGGYRSGACEVVLVVMGIIKKCSLALLTLFFGGVWRHWSRWLCFDGGGGCHSDYYYW